LAAIAAQDRGAPAPQGDCMDRNTLLFASLIADGLDLFVVGQIPGLSYVIDVPLVLMHVIFAGPAGFSTLLELIPVVGTVPLFTIAALCHKPKHAA
jgi:hypothetical protein